MSCSPFSIDDYFLEELSAPQARQVEAHVKTCAACGEELDRLRILGAALRSVPDEEIPQRIAFVSDKIFEPSPWRRRLAAFWNSGARLGFVSAAMLSASLVVFALRPAPAPVVAQAPGASTPAITQASAPSLSRQQIQDLIQAATDKAVGERSAEFNRQLTDMREQVSLTSYSLEMMQKRYQTAVAANYTLPKESVAKPGDRQ
ncbi:MAG TPA: zf-HC2 domain-containing protein [Bryobacteraceae bacterium]|jgi:anti-sigma factor RsiW|nr:zf-HC2 domain-containing protein [Bryobacteraceae bacterium]